MRPGREIPMPGLPGVDSRLAVPAMALGQLVGVIVAESAAPSAFDDDRRAGALGVAATLVGSADRALRAPSSADESGAARRGRAGAGRRRADAAPTTTVRYFAVDGSTFVDGDYLIKGVAGRILWSLLRQHVADGRVDFTNRELRLDPTLELPGFKDNLESRLILLKRRLDERGAPVRIEKTGRGRFRLEVDTALRLVEQEAPPHGGGGILRP